MVSLSVYLSVFFSDETRTFVILYLLTLDNQNINSADNLPLRFVIDSGTFCNVPQFILINDIQGKTFVMKNISCFKPSYGCFNPHVFTFDFGDRKHLYIEYFTILDTICVLSRVSDVIKSQFPV